MNAELISVFTELKGVFVISHIIGVFGGMGGALLSDLLFTFYSKDRLLNKKEQNVLNILSNIIWTSLGVIIITGIGIFLSDPVAYLDSPKFLTKMSIVFILTLNGYVLHRYVQPHLSNRGFLKLKTEHKTRVVAFTCGAISIISWLSACVLGLIKTNPFEYFELMTLYTCTVVIAICVAVLVEKKTFK